MEIPFLSGCSAKMGKSRLRRINFEMWKPVLYDTRFFQLWKLMFIFQVFPESKKSSDPYSLPTSTVAIVDFTLYIIPFPCIIIFLLTQYIEVYGCLLIFSCVYNIIIIIIIIVKLSPDFFVTIILIILCVYMILLLLRFRVYTRIYTWTYTSTHI